VRLRGANCGPQRCPAAAAICGRTLTELRSLREELSNRRQAVGDGTSTPANGSLEAQLSELKALLVRRAALAPAPELDLNSSGPRRAELFQRSADPEPEISDDDRLSKKFCLWSPQRALDEFGMPDWVGTDNGSMCWRYYENDRSLETALIFAEGFVVQAWVSDDV